MKHFIGGSAIGLLFTIIKIPHFKKATEMDNIELCAYVSAHFFIAAVFGLAVWGIL